MKDENRKLNDTPEKETEISDEMLEGVSGGVNLKPSVDLTGKKGKKSKAGKNPDFGKEFDIDGEKNQDN